MQKINMSDLVIRRASKEDVPVLVKIEQHTSACAWSQTSLEADVENAERAVVLVAELEGVETGGDEFSSSVIGYTDAWLVAGEAQINNIGVLAPYRKNGVGEALLMKLMETSRAAGCTIMDLEVRKSNRPAIKLYEKLGFVRDGLRKAYYEDNGEDAVLMSVRL
ncbi:MAG: ribosomal protein S18-alanine N-acetyltransferase [Mogibacterium sp.]|nr:ribosomal protein S18-alanine N-acetyltransferase [Mogibacterium sp.]